MNKINLLIIFFMLISCSKKQDNLDKRFKDTLIEYQKKFPIPSNANEGQYVFIAVFNKINNDTTLLLSRSSAGLIKGLKGYGVFEDKMMKPIFIYDEKKYSKNFVFDTVSNRNVDIFYSNKSNKESYPPNFTYLVKGKEIRLLKIDTIWKRWD
jgi:hypothetical protein